MPTFSASLKAQADAQPTKLAWSNTVKTLLGNTRRVRCFRNGVEFLNIASTGDITTVAGNITGFGVLGASSVRTAADLSTGSSTLVLEGNGHSITYTLGLTGSGKEFVLSRNPTGSSMEGFAFSVGSGMKAPVLLDSGTGFLSPVNMAKTPYTVELYRSENYQPVLHDSLTFNVRRPNWVPDDLECAESMGDVRVMFSSKTMTLGGMEFGAIMWGMNEATNSVTNEPVYEVLILQKPLASNWSNYPADTGWIEATTDTFAPAHKLAIKTESGVLLKMHEMYDGLFINDDRLATDGSQLATKPIRNYMHCAAGLPWWSHKPKLHKYASKYYAGAVDEAMNPKINRTHYSTNPAIPVYFKRAQNNGLFSFFSMPKRSVRMDATAINAAIATNQDPWLYNLSLPNRSAYSEMNYGGNFAFGWGEEPGAFGGIDTLCGPGGIRNDRTAIPLVYAIKMTNPNFVRPFNNDPIDDMVEAFQKCSYYTPQFFNIDVRTGATIPLTEIMNNEWSHGRGYYGAGVSFTPGGQAKSVPMFAIANGASNYYVDKNGRTPWNGQANDYLHNYWDFGWQAVLFNSPMAAYAMKHRLISSIMCQQGSISDTADPKSWFLVRQHAWRWRDYGFAWKLSSDHADLGIPRSMIEKRIQNELDAMYTYQYFPTMEGGSTVDYHRCLRNLGIPISYGSNGAQTSSQSMQFYLGQVLHMWKQFGLWDMLWNKSEKNQKVLKFIIRCMDLHSVDFMLETKGQNENYLSPWVGSAFNVPLDLAASWADYVARVEPRNGVADWTTLPNGARRSESEYASQHLRYQWVRIRLDYFSDIPCERPNGLELAAAEYKKHYTDMLARTENITDRGLNNDTNWVFFGANMASIKPYNPSGN